MGHVTTTPDPRRKELDEKLRRIEASEAKLKALEEELLRLQIRMSQESAPIIEAVCEVRYQTLTKLRIFLSDEFFKKHEREKIARLVDELARGLLDYGDDRALGFLEVEEFDDADHIEHEPFRHMPPREKTSETKIELKTLFRDLAKVFHPDRETREEHKEAKTEIMQKITAAYENKDLSGLLRIEKEHLGAREFSEDKIALYTAQLNERLRALRDHEASLKKHGPLSPVYKFLYSRKSTLREYNFQNEISKLEEELERERELQAMVWDRVSLRSYLKA